MSQERLHPVRKSGFRAIFSTALFAIATTPLAFAYSTRREIGERDNWTCQHCGDSFQKGAMIHMAHYPKAHQPDGDTNPEHGRALCIRCHLVHDHLPMWAENPTEKNWNAVKLLSQLAWRNGYHNFHHYRRHPEAFVQDRRQLIQDLSDFGIVMGHFCTELQDVQIEP